MELTEILSALGGTQSMTQSMARELGISGAKAGRGAEALLPAILAIGSTTSSAWLAATCAERLGR